MGTNCSGCLAVGDNVNSLEPRCIEEFSGLKIVGISAGSGPHVLLLTEGCMFSLSLFVTCNKISALLIVHAPGKP